MAKALSKRVARNTPPKRGKSIKVHRDVVGLNAGNASFLAIMDESEPLLATH